MHVGLGFSFPGGPVPKKLLVVEDNDVQREGLVAFLRASGFEILSASDADEAYGLAERHHPDLILLDMMMRETDGWDFLERRREGKLRDVPVLIVTGIEAASDEWAADLGANGLVKKPINVDEMVKTIHERIG
jgi:CheY-like chemotaxis protein